MSNKKLYPHNGEMMDAEQIRKLCYPVKVKSTVQTYLNQGKTVQEIIDYDTIKASQLGRRKGQKASKVFMTGIVGNG